MLYTKYNRNCIPIGKKPVFYERERITQRAEPKMEDSKNWTQKNGFITGPFVFGRT